MSQTPSERTHQEYQEMILERATLWEREEAALNAHLAECEACRTFAALVDRFDKDQSDAFLVSELSQIKKQELINQIMQKSTLRQASPVRPAVRWSGALAVFAIGLLFFTFWLSLSPRGDQAVTGSGEEQAEQATNRYDGWELGIGFDIPDELPFLNFGIDNVTGSGSGVVLSSKPLTALTAYDLSPGEMQVAIFAENRIVPPESLNEAWFQTLMNPSECDQSEWNWREFAGYETLFAECAAEYTEGQPIQITSFIFLFDRRPVNLHLIWSDDDSGSQVVDRLAVESLSEQLIRSMVPVDYTGWATHSAGETNLLFLLPDGGESQATPNNVSISGIEPSIRYEWQLILDNRLRGINNADDLFDGPLPILEDVEWIAVDAPIPLPYGIDQQVATFRSADGDDRFSLLVAAVPNPDQYLLNQVILSYMLVEKDGLETMRPIFEQVVRSIRTDAVPHMLDGSTLDATFSADTAQASTSVTNNQREGLDYVAPPPFTPPAGVDIIGIDFNVDTLRVDLAQPDIGDYFANIETWVGPPPTIAINPVSLSLPNGVKAPIRSTDYEQDRSTSVFDIRGYQPEAGEYILEIGYLLPNWPADELIHLDLTNRGWDEFWQINQEVSINGVSVLVEHAILYRDAQRLEVQIRPVEVPPPSGLAGQPATSRVYRLGGIFLSDARSTVVNSDYKIEAYTDLETGQPVTLISIGLEEGFEEDVYVRLFGTFAHEPLQELSFDLDEDGQLIQPIDALSELPLPDPFPFIDPKDLRFQVTAFETENEQTEVSYLVEHAQAPLGFLEEDYGSVFVSPINFRVIDSEGTQWAATGSSGDAPPIYRSPLNEPFTPSAGRLYTASAGLQLFGLPLDQPLILDLSQRQWGERWSVQEMRYLNRLPFFIEEAHLNEVEKRIELIVTPQDFSRVDPLYPVSSALMHGIEMAPLENLDYRLISTESGVDYYPGSSTEITYFIVYHALPDQIPEDPIVLTLRGGVTYSDIVESQFTIDNSGAVVPFVRSEAYTPKDIDIEIQSVEFGDENTVINLTLDTPNQVRAGFIQNDRLRLEKGDAPALMQIRQAGDDVELIFEPFGFDFVPETLQLEGQIGINRLSDQSVEVDLMSAQWGDRIPINQFISINGVDLFVESLTLDFETLGYQFQIRVPDDPTLAALSLFPTVINVNGLPYNSESRAQPGVWVSGEGDVVTATLTFPDGILSSSLELNFVGDLIYEETRAIEIDLQSAVQDDDKRLLNPVSVNTDLYEGPTRRIDPLTDPLDVIDVQSAPNLITVTTIYPDILEIIPGWDDWIGYRPHVVVPNRSLILPDGTQAVSIDGQSSPGLGTRLFSMRGEELPPGRYTFDVTYTLPWWPADELVPIDLRGKAWGDRWEMNQEVLINGHPVRVTEIGLNEESRRLEVDTIIPRPNPLQGLKSVQLSTLVGEFFDPLGMRLPDPEFQSNNALDRSTISIPLDLTDDDFLLLRISAGNLTYLNVRKVTFELDEDGRLVGQPETVAPGNDFVESDLQLLSSPDVIDPADLMINVESVRIGQDQIGLTTTISAPADLPFARSGQRHWIQATLLPLTVAKDGGGTFSALDPADDQHPFLFNELMPLQQFQFQGAPEQTAGDYTLRTGLSLIDVPADHRVMLDLRDREWGERWIIDQPNYINGIPITIESAYLNRDRNRLEVNLRSDQTREESLVAHLKVLNGRFISGPLDEEVGTYGRVEALGSFNTRRVALVGFVDVPQEVIYLELFGTIAYTSPREVQFSVNEDGLVQ